MPDWPEDENDLTDEQVEQMWRESTPVKLDDCRNATFPRVTTAACGTPRYMKVRQHWGRLDA